MLNSVSINAVNASKWRGPFVHPLYKDYAFSCIPGTIAKLLTGQGEHPLAADAVGGAFSIYDGVILLFIDGFGWEFFEAYRSKYPLLNQLYEKGVVSKISSQFPSTTAAHVTTLHTGQEVGQTGIYEWFYYEPLVDRMIAPLLYSYAGEHEAGTLLKKGYLPSSIFPFETLPEKLSKKGVETLAFQQEAIAHSPYSKTLLKGAKIIPFTTFSQALDAIVTHVKQPLKVPTYFYAYFGEIDSAGHRHGIGSPQFDQAIDTCWTLIEKHLWKHLKNSPNNIALLITADHGMVPVQPKETVLLNLLLPELSSRIKKNKEGIPLVPAGSCRDFFLHIQEESLLETRDLVRRQLHGIAEVVLVDELIQAGFFGAIAASHRLRERIGNLLVLPYKEHSVFWHFEKHHFEQHFYAAHGGLTPEEMHSIFLFATP